MSRSFFIAGRRGFSLVEVALALGVLAFAIVGVLGLLSAGSSTNQQNDREHLMVTMTGRIVSDLRGVPFDALWLTDPRAAVARGEVPTVAQGAPADSFYYFSADGLLLDESARPEAAYRCTVRKIADEDTRSYAVTECNLLKLQLVFQWPASAAAPVKNGRRIDVAIARY